MIDHNAPRFNLTAFLSRRSASCFGPSQNLLKMNPETEEKPETTDQSADQLDADTRREYEKACAFFGQKLSPLAKEVVDSERLSKDDFAIRIDAR